MNKKSVFETLSAVDVSSKVEKKGTLSYLPWAWAWGEVAKRYPTASYSYYRDQQTNLPASIIDGVGGFCYTEVTIEGLSHPMWLPILDHRNKPLIKPNVFDINTTLMRCLTKNLAMHGLGHYIYAGEDLPQKPILSESELQAVLKGTIENARTVLTSYEVSEEYKSIITNKFKN